MNNQSSITALMSSFGRAFHAENEDHPVFTDHLAKELMTAEEYTAVQNYIQALKSSCPNWYKAICYTRCRYGYLCFSRRRVLSEAPGIRGGSSSDAKR